MALGEGPEAGPDGLDGALPPLSPEDVGRHRFGTSFRGYDQQEVRAFLTEVADELARLRARHDELRNELEALRQTPPPEVNREMLMSALGDETARIVRTAEEAAEDIRAKAEEAASRLRADAAAESEAMRAEASAVLGARREEAESAASERARQAEEEAQAVLADAAWRAQEMIREAEATRDAVLSDLVEKRRVAHLQVERLGAGRDRLLEAYAAVRENLEEAVSTLDRAPEAARNAAEAAERSAKGSGPANGEPRVAPARAEVRRAEPPPQRAPERQAPPEPQPQQIAPEQEQEQEQEQDPEPIAPEPEPPAPAPEPEPIAPEPEPPAPEPEPEPEPVQMTPAETAAESVFARIRAEQAAPPEPEPAAAEPVTAQAPDPEDHLQRRDVQLDPIVGPLVRKLKRSLQDEQNDVLDRIRSRKARPSLDEALGTEQAQAARYRSVARAAMEEAGTAGAQSVGEGAGKPEGELAAIAGRLADELVRPVRRAVTRALKAAVGGDDEQAVVDGVGAAYREWRSARLERVASEHLAAAYAAGVYAAAGSAKLTWVVDDGGDPCPDCDDNALAGPTPRGEPFPTGQVLPPAHSGCRCLVVPAP